MRLIFLKVAFYQVKQHVYRPLYYKDVKRCDESYIAFVVKARMFRLLPYHLLNIHSVAPWRILKFMGLLHVQHGKFSSVD